MLALSAGTEQAPAILEQLSDVHRAISDVLHAMPNGQPFSAVQIAAIADFRQAVEREFGAEFDDIDWALADIADESVRALSPLAREVFFGAAREAIRNAARHGRGRDADRPLRLRLSLAAADALTLRIEDDGVGLDAPPDDDHAAGAGQGMALHGAMMAIIGGAWLTEHTAHGMRITLSLLPEVAIGGPP